MKLISKMPSSTSLLPNLRAGLLNRESILGTIRVTALIMLVVPGASFLGFTLASAGLGGEPEALHDSMGLSSLAALIAFPQIALYLPDAVKR